MQLCVYECFIRLCVCMCVDFVIRSTQPKCELVHFNIFLVALFITSVNMKQKIGEILPYPYFQPSKVSPAPW